MPFFGYEFSVVPFLGRISILSHSIFGNFVSNEHLCHKNFTGMCV